MRFWRSSLQLVVITAIVIGTSFIFSEEESEIKFSGKKINGVNFVAPPNEISQKEMESVKLISADWISIIPYSYTPRNSSKVVYFEDHPHWWGEGLTGAAAQVQMAKNLGLKVMLKPHVWVLGEGWPGEFQLESESDWKSWEDQYSKYILHCASVADSLGVELFCFSTEYRLAVKERPEFFKRLISEIRDEFSGPLTYAANWDNFENISFWDELDYIGIDAYFPLNDNKSPDLEDIKEAWKKRSSELRKFSEKWNKKIIFTEYGYRSCDYAVRKPWEEDKSLKMNEENQSLAYQALYETVWTETWFEGGFLWKWHAYHEKSGGSENVNFTPQNKKAQEVIRQNYSN